MKKPKPKASKKKPRSRIVVEAFTRNGVVYQLEYVKCGRQRCGACVLEATHGPYWYAYRWSPKLKRLVSTYIGRYFEELDAASVAAKERAAGSAWPTIRTLVGK